MEEVNESPVIKKSEVKGMTFPQAMEEVIRGNKITRIEWDDNSAYGIYKDDFLMIHLKDKDHQWIVNSGDLMAEDWIIKIDAN
jgi:hypothetical protein